MIFSQKFLHLFFFIIFLIPVLSKADRVETFIETAKSHYEKNDYVSLFSHLRHLGFLEREIASNILEKTFETCCSEKTSNHLDELIALKDESAYYFLGLLYYLGSSTFNETANRVKAAAVFLELTPHVSESQNDCCVAAARMLLKMRLTTKEENEIYQRLSSKNEPEYVEKLMKTLRDLKKRNFST